MGDNKLCRLWFSPPNRCFSSSEKITTFLDFVIEKEHSFIRNIFNPEDLTLSQNIETLAKYDTAFKKMLRIVVLLNDNYSKDTDVGDISDDYIDKFLDEYEFDSFEDLYLDIENTQIKNARWENRKDFKLNKIITFVYSTIMDFPDNKFEIKTVVTKDFFNNVRDLICEGYVMYHSRVTGEVTGYAHDFCNKKIRENHNLIPVFAHNLFSFDFFFVVIGIRSCVWRTKQLNIGGTNQANVQYANIGN